MDYPLITTKKEFESTTEDLLEVICPICKRHILMAKTERVQKLLENGCDWCSEKEINVEIVREEKRKLIWK